MKANKLIEILKTMPQDAEVRIITKASKNGLDIKEVSLAKCGIELITDDRDFELDDDGIYEIEQEQEEEARENALEMMIDQALGK